MSASCLICSAPSGAARIVSARLRLEACSRCGYVRAHHVATDRPVDYHLQNDQAHFLESLAATRRRQGRRWVELISKNAPNATRLLDFGCGRGWFIDEAKARFSRIAGADASVLAVDGARSRGVDAVLLPTDAPEAFDASTLPFRPQVVTFLDVVEHFEPGQVRALLKTFGTGLLPELELLVVKVPAAGLLYRTASALARAGLVGPFEQLFQVGTWPPHLGYHTRESLRLLLDSAGFTVVEWASDADFEAASIGDRVGALRRLPRSLKNAAGRGIAGSVDVLQLHDSIVCVARPRSR